MIYQELYQYGWQRLEEAEIAEAKLDARLLLEYVCQTDRNALLVHGDREVTSEQEATYKELIDKRATHIPLQHLTGEQEFMGLTFEVNENVLIPRQDTEILVEEAMSELHDGMNILDMCTGSGCILLSLLHYSNDCKGVGVDLSSAALQVAKRNAQQLQLEESVTFLQSDLFEAIPQEQKFDMLVSNPPYIRTDVIPSLMEEVREHEPFMALDGLEDGLYFYRKIIAKAKDYLYPGAHVFFEIGYDQAEEVCALMEKEGYDEVRIKKDFAGLDRVVTGIVSWRK